MTPALGGMGLVWLGGATTVALMLGGAPIWAAGVAVATVGLAISLRTMTRLPRLQIALAYAYALAFYTAVEWLVPALGRSPLDAQLLGIDRALFGETPAALIDPRPWLTDVLSGCYGSYHLYLHGALIWAAVRVRDAHRLTRPVFLAFALGMAGYLLVPATGPSIASATLFAQPLQGGWLFEANRAFIARGTSLYDVFPSLHVLITLVLLAHDWRHLRARFWIALLPALGLMASTIYLRYHYAIDCLAAVGVWGLVWVIDRRMTAAASAPRAGSA